MNDKEKTPRESSMEINRCLCGAVPLVESKIIKTDYDSEFEVYKYRCPACREKELPWLGQWHDCGALQVWNRISSERSYHKRILEYNEHGVCIAPPYKTYEWRDKKKTHWNLTVNFYLDNSMYYYCFDCWYKNSGYGSGLWIGESGYPSMDNAKHQAAVNIVKHNRNLEIIVKQLLAAPEPPRQTELFGDVEAV
jgi:hypothetical protein